MSAPSRKEKTSDDNGKRERRNSRSGSLNTESSQNGVFSRKFFQRRTMQRSIKRCEKDLHVGSTLLDDEVSSSETLLDKTLKSENETIPNVLDLSKKRRPRKEDDIEDKYDVAETTHDAKKQQGNNTYGINDQQTSQKDNILKDEITCEVKKVPENDNHQKTNNKHASQENKIAKVSNDKNNK